MQHSAVQRSILDDLGEEVTAIVTPVSICMALTVMLVKTLNPTGSSDSRSVFIVSAFYTEQEGDTVGTKTVGALVNAAIFVATVTIMTFVLVWLFKHGYTKLIYGYMAFAGFSIFFVLAGILLLQLLEAWDVDMDAFSYLILLYNFAVVGVLSLFVWPAPIALKQMYLTVTGIVVAYVFTWTPEWTTWTLLVAMAIYDLFAVLMPGGPLKELVQIAEERQVDIPALVYEARSVRRVPPEPSAASGEQQHDAGFELADSAWTGRSRPRRMHDIAAGPMASSLSDPEAAAGRSSDEAAERFDQQGVRVAQGRHSQHATVEQVQHLQVSAVNGQHLPVVQPDSDTPGEDGHQHLPAGSSGHHEHDSMLLPDAIKLGLGDFIFYSILVGRAAMYDMLTVYIAFLGVIAGLGATLMLLAVYQKALPALPVSIVLGLAFYAAARLLLEPAILPLASELVFF